MPIISAVWDAEVEGLWVKANTDIKVSKTLSQENKPGVMAHPGTPTMLEMEEEWCSEANPGKSETLPKIFATL
jgi:hypothetical protein